ncbi:unnamed protein product [Amoebophrya sp. A25]|nr:unnamed protein product [Amoebophrya sp. A25]|eukprot:GSA25T00001203001.1
MFRLYDDSLNPEANPNRFDQTPQATPSKLSEPTVGDSSTANLNHGVVPQLPSITSFEKPARKPRAPISTSRGKMERTRMQRFKLVSSGVGVATSIGIMAMAVFLLTELDMTDFFSVCYSLSQAVLFFGAGLYVFVAEGRVVWPSESGQSQGWMRRFSRFLLNKIGLALFYFWIGALIMGGKNYTSEDQKTMGRCIGVISWVLSGCNIATSCVAAEGSGDERSGKAELNSAHVGKPLDEEDAAAGGGLARNPNRV